MGIKVQHVDLIMRKHRVEEGRERRNQASPKGIDEEWDLGGCPVDASMRSRPSHRLSPLIEDGGEHGMHLAHGLIVEHQRPAHCGLGGWRRAGQGSGFFPLSACFGAMTMERAELRSGWKEEQSLEEAEEPGKYGAGDGRITV